MKHTSKNRKLVFVLCTLMPVCLAFCLGTADSSYTYTDPETGIVYYGADEPGGAYSWDLALADYRQTVFEDTWANGSPPPSIPVDMNADGYLDLVFAVGREEFDDRTGDLRRNADLVYGVGDGTGHFPVLTPLVEGIEQYLFAVGDVDKNGRQDVVAILNPNEQHSYQLGPVNTNSNLVVYSEYGNHRRPIPSDRGTASTPARQCKHLQSYGA